MKWGVRGVSLLRQEILLKYLGSLLHRTRSLSDVVYGYTITQNNKILICLAQ